MSWRVTRSSRGLGSEEPLHDHGQDGVTLAGSVGVVVVDATHDETCTLGTEAFSQGDDVEVVTHLVALDHEVGLDPQALLKGRHPQGVTTHVDDLDLQRTGPPQLTQTGLDTVERAEQGQWR